MTDDKGDQQSLDLSKVSEMLKASKKHARKAKKQLKQIEAKFKDLSVENTRKMIRERLSGNHHDEDMWAVCTCFEENRSMEDGDICNTCWEAQHKE